MKKKILIASIIGGIGVFAYSIYRYIRQQADLMKNFSYNILDFGIETINPQVIKGKLSVLFTSTSDIEVTIKEFYVDFFFNGVRVGYIQDISEFVVPANSSTEIKFEYTLNPQLILGDITEIIAYTTQQKDASISVSGYATVKSGFIKVTLPIQYDTTILTILNS